MFLLKVRVTAPMRLLTLIFVYAVTFTVSVETYTDDLGSFHEVCKNSVYTYGFAYIPYPNRCGKYIQCMENEETYLVKTCPCGLHWDARSENCNFPSEADCVESKDSCPMKWSEVLTTDKDGLVQYGSKAHLQKALERGARIKIVTETYSAETDNCQKVNGDVCCEALMHISYKNWEEFQTKAYWWMINVCTTGNWHMVRYYVGGSYLSQTSITGRFSWFVYRNEDGSYPLPVYSWVSGESIPSSNRIALTRAIEQGKSVSICSGQNYVSPIQNIELFHESTGTSTIISAEHIWSVSQTNSGSHLKFQDNAYWWFLVLTSAGTRDMSRWSIGSHTSRGHNSDSVDMEWFVDDCWTKIHETNSEGSKKSTLGHLKALTESGHSLRVRFANTVMEADNIRISHDHLSVQLVSALARANATRFKYNLNWEFRIAGTTGTVRTYRPLVGSQAIQQNSTRETMKLTWFADTKKWVMLLHINMNGVVVTGSASAVRYAVEDGADIRVAYKLQGDPGFRFSRADNVNFGPRPHVSAQLVRLLADYPAGNDEFMLDENPRWSFRIVNTKGYVLTTEWIVGEHTNKDRTTERAEIKWFASF